MSKDKLGVQTKAAREQRLKILGQDEIDALYRRPYFTPEDREQFFECSSAELAVLDELHTTNSKITFLLQLGYFKARKMFFLFSFKEAEADIKYLYETRFSGFQQRELKISKGTRLKHQGLILDLCGYRTCDTAAYEDIERTARQSAVVCGKPIYIFRQVLHLLREQRLVSPAYSSLQNMVGKVVTYEQNRMNQILRKQLKPSEIQSLNMLLEDASGLHTITYLKHEPRDFSATEIKREIERGQQIKDQYHLSLRVLPALNISNESIKYYASLVGYYSVFRLKRFETWTVYIYLLCFIHHRYQRHHDNLLVSFIYYVRKFVDRAKTAAKDRVYEHRVEANRNLQKAAQVLKLFITDEVADDEPFHEVRRKAFSILRPEKLDHVANHITSQIVFDEKAFQWEHIDKLGSQFKRYLRPILSSVDIMGTPAQAPLVESIDFLKAAFARGRPLGQYPMRKVPAGFLRGNVKSYLYERDQHGKQRIFPDRYEFYVCHLLRDQLEGGDIYCRDSVRFRSFEDDLIDKETWHRDKDQLIASTGLSILAQPVEEHLAALEEELEYLIAKVNRRISTGDNEHIKIKKMGANPDWSLRYFGDDDDTNHPVFNRLKQVGIESVLDFANRHCPFMDAFEHVVGRYTKTQADERAVFANILAWGTNTGLGRMGQISDIDHNMLVSTSDNFLRLETLKEANDLITNGIAALPIFDQYDIGGQVHSSSDGQKFETGLSTFNARHSPKYFDLKKGVVSYTLVANHVPVNAQIIGANEHESHYVFDILFNNTSDIQSETHSTDTHGSNEVNFAILHMFDYQFAPRYRDISDKVATSLYGFRHPSHYSGLLTPVRQIRKKLIIDDWDWIQRIMVSLALKTTTQSIITGKLSAYARKNKTRSALREYDNIIRSLYLLRYIDEPPLRRNVQLALNRGESYHKLRKAVAFANFGKLRFKTEHEQQIWQECSRLITNCIIYYNTTILSNLMTYRESISDIEGVAALKKTSPVAWQHINLHGRYEFTKNLDLIDMENIIRTLSKMPATN
ncbi:MAG: Tn3 family transposase [Robiginitomaculum sp.]